MSKSTPGFEAHPAVADAIRRASLYSVQVRFEEHLHNSTLEVICFSETKRNRITITQFDFMLHGEEIIVDAINKMVKEFDINDRARIATLESELRDYKAAVKDLAFQLEMTKDVDKATAIRIDGIRLAALKQASRHVMDFGVPRSGAELERLCKEIEGLKTTKDLAISEALQKMQEAFGNER
jgi:hypothetical protein